MLKTILFAVTFLICVIGFGQNQAFIGVVIDADTKTPLSLANITVQNKNFGTTSNRFGEFNFIANRNISEDDTIVVSFVGYKTTKVPITDLNGSKIELSPQSFALKDLIVIPSTRRKEVTLNAFRPRSCFIPQTDAYSDTKEYWIPHRPQEPTIEAIYFPFEEGSSEIKFVKNVTLSVKTWKLPCSFRLRLFNTSESSQPEKDLLSENLIITVTEKEQLVKVDLEEYNIIFPKNGLFVGFELLIIPENQFHFDLPDGSEPYIQYAPFLQYYNDRAPEYLSWIYTQGGWSDNQRTIEYSSRNIQYLTPAISMVLIE